MAEVTLIPSGGSHPVQVSIIQWLVVAALAPKLRYTLPVSAQSIAHSIATRARFAAKSWPLVVVAVTLVIVGVGPVE